MGYTITEEIVLKNIRYYFERTSHGSTISLCVFSYVLYPFDPEEVINYFLHFSHSICKLILILFFIHWKLLLFDCHLPPFIRYLQAWVLSKEGAFSDICDTQGGTTAEGIHVVPMASSINMLLFRLCGIEPTQQAIKFNPKLPKEVELLELAVLYRRKWMRLHLTQSFLRISGYEHGRDR